MNAFTTEPLNKAKMKTYLKAISFIASGIALGAIAGKIVKDDQQKAIKKFTSRPTHNVKNYLKSNIIEDNDYRDYKFV